MAADPGSFRRGHLRLSCFGPGADQRKPRAARSEKTSVLAQALGVTALLGVGAALFCTFFAELPIRVMYPPEYMKAARLVPWFAWCILPLPLASVLINNLLARERFLVVPYLAGIATAYYFTLRHVAQIQPQKFENIIWTLGLFGVLLLIGCLGFTWWESRSAAGEPARVNA